MRLMKERTAAGSRWPAATCSNQVAQARKLGAQAVVDVDQVLAGRLLVGRVAAGGVGRGAGRAGRLVPGGLRALARAVVRRRHDLEGAGAVLRRAASGVAAAAPPRPASTSSRTRGAVSWAKRWTSSAELTDITKVLKPCSSVSSASCSGSIPGRC